MMLLWSTRQVRRPLLLIIIFFACVDIILGIVIVRNSRQTLTVAFLDVGQGDAMYVESPNGTQLLFDSGPPSGAVLRALSKVMPFWDRSIDVLVLSHPDLDHIGGVPDVLSRYEVGAVVYGSTEGGSLVALHLPELIAMEHASVIKAQRNTTIELGSRVHVELLYPFEGDTFRDTNDSSVVLRLDYGSTSFLTTGDLPQGGELRLVHVEGESGLHSSILKLGHHGSRTSSSEEFLRVVAPSAVIISAGKDNRYGHPHQEVLDRVRALGIPAFSTANEGTIIFESDGTHISKQ